MFRMICTLFIFSAISFSQQPAAQKPPEPGSAEALVQQADALLAQGRHDKALALYNQALDKSPESYQAQLGAGVALDLKANYSEAREHLEKAIELAPARSKQQALRALAISYAFEGNAYKASESEMQVFNTRLAKNDSIGAAETCDELARVYLESGDLDHAYKWYKMGYETATRKPGLTDDDKNLWLFRWENAQARIAARRSNAAEAQQHVAAAKAALDKIKEPGQGWFYFYLTGYVALYSGDYKAAIEELQKANQQDPFVLSLLAQAYEKSGDAVQAKAYYQKVLATPGHTPTSAFSRPLAMKKLAAGS